MHCLGGRVIEHELLDETEPARAERSLGDLVRINRLLGGHEAVRRIFEEVVKPPDEFSLLDVGAASGDMGRVIKAVYPAARVISLDYVRSHLEHADPPRVVGDAFAIPVRRNSFDYVFCSLFLHHFSDEQVIALLKSFGGIARRYVVVTDLERHPLAYYFLPATKWIFRWDAITLHDGPISVEAAFTREELGELAKRAGLANVVVRRFRPAFRLGLVANAT